jgi:hypothetical protein
MLSTMRILSLALLGAALVASTVQADLTDTLKKGTPDLKSIGPISFGPDGVLFVSDPQGGALFAIDTADKANTPATGTIKVGKIDEKVAGVLGTDAKDILINDLAVNPASGNVYLSVSRGKGPDAKPALIKLDHKGKVEAVELKDVKFSKAALANLSDKKTEAVTCIAFVKGQVLVAGLGNENWASTLRSVPFPFTEANKPTSVEIFHGAHGKFETNAPVRTFVPFDFKGQTNILAAYTCTPLVKFSVDELKPGAKVKGTTVAELGNGNRPLDMITYEKGGKPFLLLSNNKRGVMKIKMETLDDVKGIVAKTSVAGLPYDTIKELDGIQQLAKLDKDNAVILIRAANGELNLDTVPLP